MNLYYLETVVNGFEHGGRMFDNLSITWHIWERPEHIAVNWHFPLLIQDYEKLNEHNLLYCEGYITEHFTELEKDELFPEIIAGVKSRFEVVSTNVIKAELPAPGDMTGLRAIPCGGGTEIWLVNDEETGYKFGGYYDVYDVTPHWEEAARQEKANLLAAVDAWEMERDEQEQNTWMSEEELVFGPTPSQERLQALKEELGGIQEYVCADGNKYRFAWVTIVDTSSVLGLFEENGKLNLGNFPNPL